MGNLSVEPQLWLLYPHRQELNVEATDKIRRQDIAMKNL